jgi:hypothetical protein
MRRKTRTYLDRLKKEFGHNNDYINGISLGILLCNIVLYDFRCDMKNITEPAYKHNLLCNNEIKECYEEINRISTDNLRSLIDRL